MAETLPTENVQSAAQDQTFGGTGYRLGGQTTASASDGASGFGDFGDYGGSEQYGDDDWEIQQAIAMSLQEDQK